MISFDPVDNEEEQFLVAEYAKRMAKILGAIKVSYTDELLVKFVKNDFPDMRSLVQKTQSFYKRGIKQLDAKDFNINYDFKELFEICLLKPDPVVNYKFIVSQYGSKIDDALAVLGKDFIEYLKNTKPEKIHKIPEVIIAVAEYQYQKQFVIDPLITLLACVFKVQHILQ